MFLRRISSVMSASPRRSGSPTIWNLSLALLLHGQIHRFRNVNNVFDNRLERRAFLMVEGKNLLVSPIGQRKILYTGTPIAAASRFMVPPPLTTKSEFQMMFIPSST